MNIINIIYNSMRNVLNDVFTDMYRMLREVRFWFTMPRQIPDGRCWPVLLPLASSQRSSNEHLLSTP